MMLKKVLLISFICYDYYISREEVKKGPTSGNDYSIFIETFNCGEKNLNEMDFQNIVPLNQDIYIFSLQECMKVKRSLKAISRYLNSSNEYTIQMQSIGSDFKLVGYHGVISIIVAVRTSILCSFNPSLDNTVYEGFNLYCTRLGNKGAAAISIRLPHYSLLAIASHFSSDLKVLNWFMLFTIGTISFG